ncbi:MAG TPA: N-acetylmuramoyl-L-alanine amidase, partial [Chroococcales cyanobacterium]
MGTVPTVCYAQPAWDLNRVVGVNAEPGGGSVVLETRSQAPVAAPSIKYLPGANGETMMVADFFGVSSTLPPRVIRVDPDGAGARKGITQVRIGQFQSSPPILRIAVSARDPAALRSLSFGSQSGALVVKWAKISNSTPPTPEFEREDMPVAMSAGTARSLEQEAETPRQALSPNARPTVAPLRGELPLAKNAGVPLSEAPAALAAEAARPLPPSAPNVVRESAPAKVASTKMPAAAPDLVTRLDEQQKQSQKQSPKHPSRETRANDEKASASTGEKRGLLSHLFGQPGNGSKTDETRKAGDTRQDGSSSKKNDDLTFEALYASARMPSPAPQLKKPSGDYQRTAKARNGIADATAAFQPATLEAVRRANHMGLVDAIPKKNSDIEAATISVRPGLEDANSSQQSLNITIATTARLTFKSFRLHDPERYVIDFTGSDDLVDAEAPSVSDNPLVKAVRIGTMPGDDGEKNEKKVRLVIDLADAEAFIGEHLNTTGTAVTLSVTRDRPSDESEIATPTPGKPLSGQVVVVDAGHGGSDPGAQRGTIQEKQITLDITQKLKARLGEMGARVVMTRSDDTFVSLEDRVKLTNAVKPSLFVSVHINALESTSDIHGIETYFQTEQSKPLADAIHKALVADLSAPDRSVRQARFYVINHTPVPAILAEVGFISNKDEREKLISSDYQAKIAEALAEGVTLYVSKNPVKPGSTATSRHIPYQRSGTTIGKGTTLSGSGSIKSKLAASPKVS